MISLELDARDMARMRFGYSPLAEAAESLYMLHAGRLDPLQRPWYDMVRHRLPRADTWVLRAIVPAAGYLANFLLLPPAGTATTMAEQLDKLAQYPPDRLRADLAEVWRGPELPPSACTLADEGAAGLRRIADHLFQYWRWMIEPHWPRIRALLDGDVAYRASRLTKGGIGALLADLHPNLTLSDPAGGAACASAGTGVILVPCAFAWPHVVVGPASAGPRSVTYGPVGVGTLWDDAGPATGDNPLGTLLGRKRAAVLTQVRLATTTTELARELGQSPSAVSEHLAVLERCGLVTSWRQGRRVLYRRTSLGSSVVEATRDSPARRRMSR